MIRGTGSNYKGSMICIAGQTGEGKTTLAVQIAEYYQGKPLDFEKQIAMGGSDFMRKRDICIKESLPVIVYDEAGDLIGKRAMSKFNIDLVRDFELQRAFQIFVILCLPSFRSLDSSLFDERGLIRAVVQVYDRTSDVGHFSYFGRAKTNTLIMIMSDRKKRPSISDHLFLPDKPCFVKPDTGGIFHDLPKDRRDELRSYSIKGKYQVLEERSAKDSGLLNYDDLAKLTGKSMNYLRDRISKARLSPEKKIGRITYYNKEVLEILKTKKEKEEDQDAD